ncbi:MAG: rhamnogalacturonan acetylesterase [Chitinophagaceae bacterium]
MKLTILLTSLLVFAIFPPHAKNEITIWMIGDSTMSVKAVSAYPETGWGMPFVYFWDSTVTVKNLAQNGRSSRTFMQENRWQPAVDNMKEGDYVFIEFGHNDEVPSKASYTTQTAFKANLTKYITDTRKKNAVPVLLTPVARRKFDSTGRVEGTHEAYSAIVREVAKENNVVLIDLDKKSMALIQAWGVEKSANLFNHLAPGEHPNYPEGKDDNTHFNELGARIIAEIVLKEIREQQPDLAAHILVAPTKK